MKLADIDAQWLNRNLTKYLNSRSAEEILNLESQILILLGNEAASLRECEKKLFTMLGSQKPDLMRLILKNRHTVYYGTKLQQAQNAIEKHNIVSQLQQSTYGSSLLNQLSGEPDSLEKQ